ncbi:guanylyl cyclase inhibitory -like [Pelobates cultripes]|uniref:Guanylyl cyclase inhibitory -like n=1 Tax=Pelobates cultripes TaxID=61616 RepID=A0AAD1RU69_PELCU|nr:guanylyl cyclase inhibitory -like [Pelobates cultripes]
MGQTASIPRKSTAYVLELHEWYRKFIEECPSGLITLHEFRRYFGDCTVGNESSEYAEQIFRTLDNNGDGIVDFREYVTAISMLAHGTPEDKLKWSFKLYDKDRDGAITRSEMLEIMKAVYKMSLSTSITNVNPMTAEECTNRIFIRLDKDRNAVISLQEFIDGSLDDDWIRDMLECDLSTVEIQKPEKCLQLLPRASSRSMLPQKQEKTDYSQHSECKTDQ